MDVRKVQDMRKNVEHQYITEDSKTRIYLSVVREFNEKEYEEYSKKKKRAKIKKRIRFLKRSMVYIVPTAVSLIFFGYGRRIDSITYRAQAQGAMRKADGTYRSEVDQKEICLEDEEDKYRTEFSDKAVKGITDKKAANAAAEIFKGSWVDTKDKWGKELRKDIEGSEALEEVESSSFAAT